MVAPQSISRKGTGLTTNPRSPGTYFCTATISARGLPMRRTWRGGIDKLVSYAATQDWDLDRRGRRSGVELGDQERGVSRDREQLRSDRHPARVGRADAPDAGRRGEPREVRVGAEPREYAYH